MPSPSPAERNQQLVPIACRVLVIGFVAGIVALTLWPGSGWSASSETLLSTNPDLTLTGGGENNTTISIGDAAPGDGGEDYVTLTNEGLESGNLTVNVSDVWGDENGTVPPEEPYDDTPHRSEMPEASRIGLWLDVDQDGQWGDGDLGLSPHDAGLIYVHPSDIDMHAPAEYEDVQWDNATEMDATESHDFRVHWDLPPDVGNEIMSDAVSFNVTFTLGTDT